MTRRALGVGWMLLHLAACAEPAGGARDATIGADGGDADSAGPAPTDAVTGAFTGDPGTTEADPGGADDGDVPLVGIAPPPPDHVQATAASCSRVELTWSPSGVDDASVRGFVLYRNGVRLRDVEAPADWAADDAAPSATPLSYAVSIVDQAGRESEGTLANSVTTPACPAPPAFATIAVSPPGATIPGTGMQAFSATARDAEGHEVPGVTFTWTSSSPELASIGADGLATGHLTRSEATTLSIVAEASGIVSPPARLTLVPPSPTIASITVSPGDAVIGPGGARQFAASARDARGLLVRDVTFAWSSSDPGAALIDDAGVATGQNVGASPRTTDIVAKAAGIESPKVRLTVMGNPGPCTYALTPGGASAPATGGLVSLALDTGASCPWWEDFVSPFIVPVTPASGSGFGPQTVELFVAPNATPDARSADIRIGGQVFTVNQDAAPAPPENDATPPLLVVAAPADGAAVLTHTVTVRGTASDPSGVHVTVNGRDAGREIWRREVTLAPGTNTITLEAVDDSAAENRTTRTLTVTRPPLPTPDGVTVTALSSSRVQVSWSASADPRVTEYLIGGSRSAHVSGAPSRPPTSFIFWGLEQGRDHCFDVSASDGSESGPPSASVCVTTPLRTDLRPPSVSLAPLPPIVSGTVTLSASATDNVGVQRVEFYRDAETTPLGVATSPPYVLDVDTTRVSDAPHVFFALARDADQEQRSAGVATRVDNGELGQTRVMPTVAVTYLAVGNSIPTRVVLRGTDNDTYAGPATLDCHQGDCHWPVRRELDNAQHTIDIVLPALTDGTRFRGARAADAADRPPPALDFQVVERFTILQPSWDPAAINWPNEGGYNYYINADGYPEIDDQTLVLPRHPYAYITSVIDLCRYVKDDGVRFLYIQEFDQTAGDWESWSAGPLGNIGNSGGANGVYCKDGHDIGLAQRAHADVTYHALQGSIHSFGHHMEALLSQFAAADSPITYWGAHVGIQGHAVDYRNSWGALTPVGAYDETLAQILGAQVTVVALNNPGPGGTIRIDAVTPGSIPAFDSPLLRSDYQLVPLGTSFSFPGVQGNVAVAGRDLYIYARTGESGMQLNGYRPSADLGIVKRCGSTHYPPNAEGDYDTSNASWTVRSDCDDWTPDMSGEIQNITCAAWGCSEDNSHLWRFQNMPGVNNGLRFNAGERTYQMRNVWALLFETDRARARSPTLYLESDRVQVGAPTSLSATPASGSVLLTWPRVPGAAGYNVFRRQADQTPDTPSYRVNNQRVADPEGAATVAYTDTLGLLSGVTYTYEVKAVGAVQAEHGPSVEVTLP